MMNIALLYGGRSTEHEVSINSSKSVFTALVTAGYGVLCIGIAKDGTWHLQDPAKNSDALPGAIVPQEHDGVYVKPGDGFWNGHKKLEIAVVFPVTHGTEGEDGRLQGLCDLAHVPCVGCDAPSSTIGMHKDVAKQVFANVGIPVVPSVTLQQEDLAWLADDDDAQLPRFIESFLQTRTSTQETSKIELPTTRSELFKAAIIEALGSGIVVKPESGGSSVGVTMIERLATTNQGDADEYERQTEELLTAVALAAEVCDAVLLEPLVAPMHEVECAILETEDEGLVVGGPGMVYDPLHDKVGFLSYEHKYGDDQPATMRIPAPIAPSDAELIRQYAKLAFTTIGANGYARVDFFITDESQTSGTETYSSSQKSRIFLNEINTLPGMTNLSHYPRLIASEEYDMPMMVQIVVQEAIDRYSRLERIKHTL